MSECADQRHLMGIMTDPLEPSYNVYIDEYFAEEKKVEDFMKFNFCPNCGKELKEFYEEDK